MSWNMNGAKGSNRDMDRSMGNCSRRGKNKAVIGAGDRAVIGVWVGIRTGMWTGT